MLRKGAFAELEAQTTALQKRFEAGQETEFALREAYRPFYDLNEQDWKSLAEGDQNKAIRYFHKALELGAKAGGEVPQELKYSWYYRCKFPELAAYCR